MCTRDCWHCPAVQRGHKLNTMDQPLYDKIVKELHDLKWNGVVQWFFVNEPLLDKQWEARITQLRREVPRCTIHVTSNWDTQYKREREVQLDTVLRLFAAGVNSLNINDYDVRGTGLWLPKMVRDALPAVTMGAHNWQPLGPRHHHFSVMEGHPVKLHSWSGYNKSTMNGKGKCARPHRHLTIGWDGSVYLCCAVNPTTATVFGNLHTQSMVEVWNGRKFFEYRWHLQQGIRQGDCNGCVVPVAYPRELRHVSIPEWELPLLSAKEVTT